MNTAKNRNFLVYFSIFAIVLINSCSSFRYKTFDEEALKTQDDPEPNYNITMNKDYQDFTTYMFMGNRIENFSTYFNTYFNARENFDDAYDEYVKRVLAVYSERLDSIFEKPPLPQEAIDKFTKAIEKASKIIQYHKSSQFMDKSVLLIGQSYYYLGDYLKAERKFSEFLSKLNVSPLYEEAVLFMAGTQLRLNNDKTALDKLDELIAKSKNNKILSGAYQSKAEYYLYKKDYENAIVNFRKAIEYSSDSEFKAQMQYIVATVTERLDTKKAVAEFEKVMDYGVTFDLEYLARYNYVKNLIINNSFAKSIYELEDLEVKYKDIPLYLGEINYLKGTYFEQKKEMKKALDQFYFVILTYPSTKASSDASYRIGLYEENVKQNYLNALRYYRFSSEQSQAGTYHSSASSKTKVFKNYFDLKSIIIGVSINTDYDSTFRKKTSKMPLQNNNEEPGKIEEETGKPGGNPGFLDSLLEGLRNVDTSGVILKKNDSDEVSRKKIDTSQAGIKKISQAKYEIAELFLYDLNRADSCEYYLRNAYENSTDYEFKAKVLFALANLFRNTENSGKSDEILKQIIDEYPSSSFAVSSKRLLNIPVDTEEAQDPAEAQFMNAEKLFMSRSYDSAMVVFREIIDNFPASKYAVKSLFAAGWIYENIRFKPDSAYAYYSFLVAKSPASEQAVLVVHKINEYDSFFKSSKDSTGINDSVLAIDSMAVKDSLDSYKEMPDKKDLLLDKEKKDGTENDPSGKQPSMKKEDNDDGSDNSK